MKPGQTVITTQLPAQVRPLPTDQGGTSEAANFRGRQPAQSLVATCHKGLRFSTKAATPSLPSSPCKQRLKFSAA